MNGLAAWAAARRRDPALRLMKRNALAGLSGTLDDALEREIEAQVQCLKSQDMMEGVQAFFQKRRPSFKGT